MATVLTTENLDILLQSAIDTCTDEYPDLFNYLDLAYSTGLRMVEVLDVNRFARFGENYIDCTLAKNSGVRRFPITNFTKTFLQWIDSGYAPEIWNFNTVHYTMAKHVPIIKFNEEGQRLVTHLFRHNFIRKKYAEGMTIPDIQNLMHHSQSSITSGYIFSALYTYP